ncbi:MAG: AraC family transcriptional regulator [Halioglobus sp.]
MPTLLLPVGRALEERGIAATPFFEHVGINTATLGDPDRRIPREKFHRLMRAAVVSTGDESFGLAAAHHMQPQVLQALGLSWLASDSVHDGLRRMSRFARFISTGFTFTLQEEEQVLHAWLDGPRDSDDPVWAVLDYGLGMIVQMCRHTVGERLAPISVLLERSLPQDASPWRDALCDDIAFEAEADRITWRLTDIEQHLVTGDPLLARVTDARAQQYLDGLLDKEVSRRVADRIVYLLPDGVPSQAQLAADLHMSSRTLQRRLRSEGTSFAQVLRAVRLELAHNHLCHYNRSVLETAYLLGFSEPSTFSRAFKDWTGLAPADYRAEHSVV